MTIPQVEKYGRCWGAVCQVNHWRMGRGRLAPEARLEASEWHTQVAALAEQHALQQHRSIEVEDLRRACNAVITRKYCSTHDLSNPQLTRLFTLFKLLIDPTDMDAIIEWQHPEEDEKRRLLWAIRNAAPWAYTAKISADKFGTKDWESLGLDQLHQLMLTLRGRKAKWQRGPGQVSGSRAQGSPGQLMYVKK